MTRVWRDVRAYKRDALLELQVRPGARGCGAWSAPILREGRRGGGGRAWRGAARLSDGSARGDHGGGGRDGLSGVRPCAALSRTACARAHDGTASCARALLVSLRHMPAFPTPSLSRDPVSGDGLFMQKQVPPKFTA